jgi:hypothetical protein
VCNNHLKLRRLTEATMRVGEELLVLQGYLALVMESVEVVHEHARGNLILYRLTVMVKIYLLHYEKHVIAKQELWGIEKYFSCTKVYEQQDYERELCCRK